jgi:signal transduction histidine kinase
MRKQNDQSKTGTPILARFRTQLFILVLLVFIPSLLLAIRNNFNERRAKRRTTQEKAMAAAELVAAHQENFIRNARQLLVTISQFPFLVATDDRAFSQIHFINLRAISPEYLDFGLIERDGTLFCSTVITNKKVDLSNWSCFQRAAKTLQFSIGNLDTNGTTAGRTLDFALPILDNEGALKRVLFASLDIARLRKAIGETESLSDASIMILDSTGNVLAWHSDSEKEDFTDRDLGNDPYVQQVLRGTNSVFEMTGLNRIQKLFAVATLSDASKNRLWISVGIPTSTLFAEADRELWRNIGFMVLVALLALAVAYLYAEQFFLRPLHSLIDDARLLAAGKWSAQPGAKIHGGGELGELSRTFSEMAVTLEAQRTDINRINAELEQRVQDRTMQLEEAGRELEAFSYSVSHDLRAPLRHIAGFVDLLRNELGEAVSQKSKRFLGIIEDSARQMGQLIDELLVFSKMGRVEMQKSIVNTNQLVAETIAGLEPETQNRNIIWKIGTLPDFRGDPAMLRQVFINLLSNAIKYSRTRNPACIEVGHEILENEIVIFVRDNGVGFDMQFANKLFGVFQRLHQADEFEGTGIGLANVRRIVQRHGGRTWAEAKVDEGATVYFTMPKTDSKPI